MAKSEHEHTTHASGGPEGSPLTSKGPGGSPLTHATRYPPAPGARTYIVKEGDTLPEISREYYGDPDLSLRIFEANKDQLTDPDEIKPGQKLLIP